MCLAVVFQTLCNTMYFSIVIYFVDTITALDSRIHDLFKCTNSTSDTAFIGQRNLEFISLLSLHVSIPTSQD